MHVIFAYIDYNEPRYYNARSVFLLIVLAFLTYLVSPWSSMQRKERKGLMLVYPAIIFVYWFLFQVMQFSFDPHVHYYLGPTGLNAWMTNSFICFTFGAAFSISIMRTPGIGRRLYGSAFLVLYLLLIVLGILFRPPVMTT